MPARNLPLTIGHGSFYLHWLRRVEFTERVRLQISQPRQTSRRYARRLNCVEINSSFYRSHRMSTYRRWADSTPESFRFAVKLPKHITHIDRLVRSHTWIEQFAGEVSGLGRKLGMLLVQLPPSLAFERAVADSFFGSLRGRFDTAIVCEPRQATWFTDDADSLLQEYRVGRVAADPSVVPAAGVPGGCKENVYYRLHGSPRMYYSSYDERALALLARDFMDSSAGPKTVWCIFDNTAVGAALGNALSMSQTVGLIASADPQHVTA